MSPRAFLRPWHPRSNRLTTGLALALVAPLWIAQGEPPPPSTRPVTAPHVEPWFEVRAPHPTTDAPSLSAPREPRADDKLDRSWRAPLAGGLLVFPPSFSSPDGAYDLVVHLNGNTDLVEESYGHAGLNAVVVILNLGVGSGLYEDRFEDPAAFALILDRVQAVMVKRGLSHASLRRVALAGWSSGYGGIFQILRDDAAFARVDAVLLFDSIHCGFDASWPPRMKPWQIEPIQRFARRAAEGHALLSITHSEIQTYGYLDAHKTTDAVLAAVGAHRSGTTHGQAMPELATMASVLPKAQMVPLKPLTEAHLGGLHVRGYDGNGPVTHMLHLVQMSTTAVPDLVERWRL